jgi:hypothetical protein
VTEPLTTHFGGEQDRFDAELGSLLTEFRVEATRPDATTVDLGSVVASALDPLEIAASLEAVGAGGWAVAGRFDRADVFELASLLHERVPFVPGRARSDDHLARPGSTVDLVRGAIFAVPGIVFTAALRAGGLQIAWWCLPLALTIGWSASQVVATLASTLQGRADPGGERAALATALLLTGLLIATVTCGLAVATSATAATRGVTVGFTLFMAASAVLVAFHRERLLAIALVPATAGLVVALLAGSQGLPPWGALSGQALTVLVTVALAVNEVRGVRTPPALCPGDRAPIIRAGLHGACCGLTVSVVVALAVRGGPTVHTSIAAWPLLFSLGVMEWQVRSFKWSLQQDRGSAEAVAAYRRAAWRSFLRALARFGAVLCGLSLATALALSAWNRTVPVDPLVVQVLLGAAFFADLAVVACAGLRDAVACWVAVVAAGAAAAGLAIVTGTHITPTIAWDGALLVTVGLLVALLATAHRVVRTAAFS